MLLQSCLSCGRVWILLFAFAFGLSPSSAYSQEDDPFGAGDFAEDPGEDPFAGDTFDPGGVVEDPFGDSVGDSRPSSSSQQQRKKRTKRSVARVAQQPKRAGRRKLSHRQRLRRLGIYSVDPLDEKELSILETLRSEVDLAFEEDPLSDVIEQISVENGIPILFDKAALEEESIEPSSETVSLPAISGVSLASALSLLLEDSGLTYVVRNEVLSITTQANADEHVVTRIYRKDPHWKLTEEQLTNAIQRAVIPNSWEAVGGPGAIAAVKDGLVVSNSLAVHSSINKLFAKLERLYEQKNSGSTSAASH